jgi:chromosome segregation ATPase
MTRTVRHTLAQKAFNGWKFTSSCRHFFDRMSTVACMRVHIRVTRSHFQAWKEAKQSELFSRTISELSGRTKELQSELDECQTRLSACEVKASSFQQEAEKKQNEISQLWLRVQTSDQDESKHHDMLSSLRSELHRSQKEVELLKEQAELCERHQRQQNDIISDLTADIGRRQTHISSLQAQLSTCEVQQQNQSLAEKSLREEIEASVDYATEIQRSLDVCVAENAELKSRLDAQQLIFRDLALQSSQAESAVSRLQAQLDSCHEERRERESLISTLTAEIASNKSHQAEVDASIDYATEIQRSLDVCVAENAELKSRLDAQQLIFRDLALQSSQAESAVSRLQAQLDSCHEERREREIEIRNSASATSTELLIQSQGDRNRQQLEDQIASLNAELSNLKTLYEPKHDSDGIASRHLHASVIQFGTSVADSEDLVVVLAGEVDKLNANSRRARLIMLRLLRAYHTRASIFRAFRIWNIHLVAQKIHKMQWRALVSSICFKTRSRLFHSLTTKLTSDRLLRVQQQTRALKNQLIEFMQENESGLECDNCEKEYLQQELDSCRQERDSALTKLENACKAAATAESENIKLSELLLTHQLQISHLTDEVERQRQHILQLGSSRDGLRAQLDETTAALVSQQKLVTCNSELQRMIASADAATADTSTVLESVKLQLQAALAEGEVLAEAKVVADRKCEAAFRQLEQSTSMQSKQKDHIQELSNSLSKTKFELQSILNEQDRKSQEVEDLKRSLQQELDSCRQERDSALTKLENACKAAATAESENIKLSELLLTHQLQISHLTDEVERQRQHILQLGSSCDGLRAQLDETTAALVSQQKLVTCNSELQRMIASADAATADTSTVLESVKLQLQAALAEGEVLAEAKVVADRKCEAAFRQLEQSTSMQSKQKDHIQELSNSLSKTKFELQSILNEQDRKSQEVEDLKRSLTASIVQTGQLTQELEVLQTQAMEYEAAFKDKCREFSTQEQYIRVILESLELSGKERHMLELQVLFVCILIQSYLIDFSESLFSCIFEQKQVISTIESRCFGDEKYQDESLALSSQVTHVLKTLFHILKLNPTDQAVQASSIYNEDTRSHEEAVWSAGHRNLLHKDQEQSLSVCSSVANPGLFLNATPERQNQTSGYSSPSESLHTVVTYNTSFQTSQERMEFALKV